MGKDVVPYAEEILGHMAFHFDQETTGVVLCIRELFNCAFNSTDPAPPNGDSDVYAKENLSPNGDYFLG